MKIRYTGFDKQSLILAVLATGEDTVIDAALEAMPYSYQPGQPLIFTAGGYRFKGRAVLDRLVIEGATQQCTWRKSQK